MAKRLRPRKGESAEWFLVRQMDSKLQALRDHGIEDVIARADVKQRRQLAERMQDHVELLEEMLRLATR